MKQYIQDLIKSYSKEYNLPGNLSKENQLELALKIIEGIEEPSQLNSLKFKHAVELIIGDEINLRKIEDGQFFSTIANEFCKAGNKQEFMKKINPRYDLFKASTTRSLINYY
ncbi:MAG: hypothetical protein PHT54_00795 [Candidatus Nanoarchaeia archaeon]|nr:hypothetical protein [Candidatus Nanoarchaeia archaeon]